MLVGYGDKGVLVLGLTHADLDDMKRGLTKTYEPGPLGRFLTETILVFTGVDKPDVLRQLRDAGVAVSAAYERAYLAGERTDAPRQPT